jgi:hypothetical protein
MGVAHVTRRHYQTQAGRNRQFIISACRPPSGFDTAEGDARPASRKRARVRRRCEHCRKQRRHDPAGWVGGNDGSSPPSPTRRQRASLKTHDAAFIDALDSAASPRRAQALLERNLGQPAFAPLAAAEMLVFDVAGTEMRAGVRVSQTRRVDALAGAGLAVTALILAPAVWRNVRLGGRLSSLPSSPTTKCSSCRCCPR